MLDWLKTILGDAYTDEIDKKVSEEIGKNFVARADFNKTNDEKKQLEKDVKDITADRDKQLEELKKIDPEGLQAKIEELQTKSKADAEKYEKDLADRDYATKAKEFVAKMNPRDALSGEAILSKFMSKEFKLDGDSFQGATEWAEGFKKENASHFGAAPNTGIPQGGNEIKSDEKAYLDEKYKDNPYYKK